MVTLTLRPDEQYRLEALAMTRALKRGWNWNELSDERKFHHVAVSGFREVQLMLKRIRKNTGAPIRHLTVAEQHKSGLPHWHMLIHECGMPVGKRDIQAQWHLGFSVCKLVSELDAKAAYYVAKYLAKAGSRVRSSLHYGQLRKSSLDIAPRVRNVSGAGVKQRLTNEPRGDVLLHSIKEDCDGNNLSDAAGPTAE